MHFALLRGRTLFGPLTGIEVLSTRIDGSVVVIECDFSINLTALTLEQVLGKRRNLIDQMSEQIVDQLKRLLKGTGFAEQGVAHMKDEVAVARKDDPEWYNEDANFLAAVQTVLDAKARVLGPARLEQIAGLVVEEAEQHAPFVLESAKSGDEQVVRAALTVLNSFEGFSAWKAVDKIALEALHRSTDGGGEVGRTERVSTRAPMASCWDFGSPHRSSQGLYLDDKGWCSGAPLHEWMGVTVDERAGRVTELQLKGCGLKGHLPPELAFLSDVETLDLRDNPDLDVPAYARELGLLDVTGQMHFTDKGRVQAFLKHVALTEGKKEEALLVQKHGLDGPALKRIYDEGSFKFETGRWFDKEDDVSKWHGVSVDAEGRVSQLKFIDSGLSSLTERLGELKTLQTLNLEECKGLVSLPDLSGLAQLKVENLPDHLQPWKASGYKAFSLSNEA